MEGQMTDKEQLTQARKIMECWLVIADAFDINVPRLQEDTLRAVEAMRAKEVVR